MENGIGSYRRFLDGDESAVTDIVKEYRPGLQAYLNSIVKNFAVAEDLTEDTFVKLLIKKPKDKEISSFKTWLYTIGRNLAIDWLRKNPQGRYIPYDDFENLLTEEEQFRNAYFDEDIKKAVHSALDKLNPLYKQIIMLSFFEEFSTDEISRIIKKTKRNTSVILHRAKKALKEQLEKENFNYEI